MVHSEVLHCTLNDCFQDEDAEVSPVELDEAMAMAMDEDEFSEEEEEEEHEEVLPCYPLLCIKFSWISPFHISHRFLLI